jgi:hypothetical protein
LNKRRLRQQGRFRDIFLIGAATPPLPRRGVSFACDFMCKAVWTVNMTSCDFGKMVIAEATSSSSAKCLWELTAVKSCL